MALSDNLQALKNAGFDVPDHALTFAVEAEYRAEGFKSVWKCKCGHVYRSPITLEDYRHGCGKPSKQIWPRP